MIGNELLRSRADADHEPIANEDRRQRFVEAGSPHTYSLAVRHMKQQR
jgi:hypothetical protein